MKRYAHKVTSIIALAAMAGLLAVAAPAAQDLPPGHPPIELPPDHPPINDGLPPGHPPMGGPSAAPRQPVVADPDDVVTIDAIIDAYYEAVSGAAGAARDWDRFRSLFIPEARFIAAQPISPNQPCVLMLTEQFIQFNAAYFERGGYFERDVHRRIERFGNIAHVLSTYESRRALDDSEPYSRGVNSIQLVHDGNRWWIANVMWDYEREGNSIPAEHLASSVEEMEPRMDTDEQGFD